MHTEVLATVLSAAAVLIGVWRIVHAYEGRNEAAHRALDKRLDGQSTAVTTRIDGLYNLLLERLPKKT